jgi:hypothetical protein
LLLFEFAALVHLNLLISSTSQGIASGFNFTAYLEPKDQIQQLAAGTVRARAASDR